MEDPNFEENAQGVKPVSVALEEIAEGKYRFEWTREGIK
jgi:DNA-directed RNA polymerase subunit omega